MPRNSSGIYSLPETPFVPNTPIESAPVNNDFNDIATALTQSLATTGVSSMTGPLKNADGSLSAPSITFINSLGSGFFLSGFNQISLAIAGALAAVFNSDLTIDFVSSITALDIGLGNIANSDPNVLDWYEEGTFVPVLQFGGASVGVTYTTQIGKFTRIGNTVHFTINIKLTSKGSSTGQAKIAGLPVAASLNTALSMVIFSGVQGLDEFDTNIGASIFNTSPTIIDLGAYAVDLDLGFPLIEANIANTAEFTISGTYLV